MQQVLAQEAGMTERLLESNQSAEFIQNMINSGALEQIKECKWAKAMRLINWRIKQERRRNSRYILSGTFDQIVEQGDIDKDLLLESIVVLKRYKLINSGALDQIKEAQAGPRVAFEQLLESMQAQRPFRR